MAFITSGSSDQPSSGQGGLFEGVTTYHWLVLIIATMGWMFDCMDQRIFILARGSAIKELLDGSDGASKEVLDAYGRWATMAMILGWATGGIFFGMMSDKVGRVKTMVATLLVYSGFTGLSAVSVSYWDFLLYRFLVGLGVGGMFGAAAALVAESVPGRVRSLALGSLQALSAVGNITGSLISYWTAPGLPATLLGWEIDGWRALFLVGILPSLLVIPIVLFLREPDAWKHAKEAADRGDVGKQLGTIPDLFRHPRWRHNTLVGLGLGVSGMIGLWGIGFFTPELIDRALADLPKEQVAETKSLCTALQDVGAFLGMCVFTVLATYWGRRWAFLCAFIIPLFTVSYTFFFLNSVSDAYWMLPLVGFGTLMPFGGYSIYFPELYPTRLRGVGIGFCYNVGRYATAAFLLVSGYFTIWLAESGVDQPFRVGAVIFCSIFFLGMLTLIWAPETKGQPLPEDN
ncbi:MAG: MFS transporter [Candidatus Omnitrophica bacterium]|nr:MFS transporter [Candidatus Omnitrophota bacterium]